MSSLNKVMLIGNLGQAPEVKYTPSGDAVCTLSIATSETWKDKATGEKKEAAEWHRVVFWGRLAEIAGEYLDKGAKIYVEGKLTTRKWTDKEGVERYTTEIRASEMKMLGSKADRGDTMGPSGDAEPPKRDSAKQHGSSHGGFDDLDDDKIPF